MASARLFCGLVSSFAIHKVPRRWLYGVSGAILFSCDFGLATYGYVKNTWYVNKEEVFLETYGWIPVVLIMIFFSCHSLGWLPVTHLIMSEIFPTDIRTLSTGISMAVSFGIGGIVVKTFPTLKDVLSYSGVFFMFGCFGMTAVICGCLFIPENKGLSLITVEDNMETSRKSKKKPPPEKNESSNDEETSGTRLDQKPGKMHTFPDF